eukprot:TRINITY_DN7939_c0_g3_i1.p1 TRINITY_DN7939_c0_g3~~TRINITY_DN7939_c0_g3_i1.p1  ORF type:complete len:107 (+),score=19.30 TRINITY_DN7939_c0_g3_i1:2-322(+)
MSIPKVVERHTDEARKYQEQLRNIITNDASQTDHTPIGCWSWEEQVVDQKSLQKYISKPSNTTDGMADVVFDVVACGAAFGLSWFLLRLKKGFFKKPQHHKDLHML